MTLYVNPNPITTREIPAIPASTITNPDGTTTVVPAQAAVPSTTTFNPIVIDDTTVASDVVNAMLFYGPNNPFIPLALAAPPAYDLLTQNVLPAPPVQVNGVWTQAWTIIERTAAEQAAQLVYLQTQQSNIILSACDAACVGGFTSSALGIAYTYPSKQTDQANLAANVLASLMPGIPSTWTTMQMCQSSIGVWGYVAHTAAQIQQVGQDGKAAIMNNLIKNATLQAEISAVTLTTPNAAATIQAVIWS